MQAKYWRNNVSNYEILQKMRQMRLLWKDTDKIKIIFKKKLGAE